NNIAAPDRDDNDAITILVEVAVHVNAICVVVPRGIVANRGPVATVGNIDAVFIFRARRAIVFDQKVIDVPGEDAPSVIIICVDVAYGDKLGEVSSGADRSYA